MSDEAILRSLNQQYIDAFMTADTAWYREHLAPEFICIESDGSVLDKAAFLAVYGAGPDVTDYRLAEVSIRIYGITALVQATGLFVRKDGTHGRSRYIDVYVKADGTWRAVSAQVTRG